MPSGAKALIALTFALVALQPSIALAQSGPLIECAYESQLDRQIVYLVWDRAGTMYPNGCTSWDGLTLTDAPALAAHAIYGWALSPQTPNDGAAIWACTTTYGAPVASQAQSGVSIFIGGAQPMNEAWDDWLARHYGAAPCAALLAAYGNQPPYYYRQAW